MTDLSGQYLGRYYVVERLGEGGMAVVYKGYDTRLERDVAVKIIRSDAFAPSILDQILKRFEREAKSLAKLSHANIVNVYDYGDHEGSPFLVMEYLPGGTLKQMLGRPIPWQEALRIFIPVAHGVAYAHRRGILHRDIKPANILITEGGEPKLSDFGIARLFEAEQTTALTGIGTVIGTPEYMAPEQWNGTTSPQSDLYSLGIVLYEMVAGRKPYVADTPAAILLMQANEPLPSPRKFAVDVPEALEHILVKALAREPENRHRDVNAFVDGLEKMDVQRSTGPSPEPEPVGSAQTAPLQKPAPPPPTQAATRVVGGAGPAAAYRPVSSSTTKRIRIGLGLLIALSVIALSAWLASPLVKQFLKEAPGPAVTATSIPAGTLSSAARPVGPTELLTGIPVFTSSPVVLRADVVGAWQVTYTGCEAGYNTRAETLTFLDDGSIPEHPEWRWTLVDNKITFGPGTRAWRGTVSDGIMTGSMSGTCFRAIKTN